jgi:hypothetical protein
MSRLRNHAFIAHFSFFLCLICLPTSSQGQTEYIIVLLLYLLSSQHLSASISPYTLISTVTSALGRKKNVRSLYCEGHRRFETHERVQRSKNHNYMPNIIGRWFPRRDVLGDEDFYFASLLVFLRPWRDLGQLRAAHRTWKEEGLHFLDSTTTEQRDVIAGMQYYYDSKTAAQHLSEDDNDDPTNQILDTEMGIDEEDEFENQLKVNCVVRCV